MLDFLLDPSTLLALLSAAGSFGAFLVMYRSYTRKYPGANEERAKKQDIRLDKLEASFLATQSRIIEMEAGLKEVSIELKSMSINISSLNTLIQNAIDRVTARIDNLVDKQKT